MGLNSMTHMRFDSWMHRKVSAELSLNVGWGGYNKKKTSLRHKKHFPVEKPCQRNICKISDR